MECWQTFFNKNILPCCLLILLQALTEATVIGTALTMHGGKLNYRITTPDCRWLLWILVIKQPVERSERHLLWLWYFSHLGVSEKFWDPKIPMGFVTPPWPIETYWRAVWSDHWWFIGLLNRGAKEKAESGVGHLKRDDHNRLRFTVLMNFWVELGESELVSPDFTKTFEGSQSGEVSHHPSTEVVVDVLGAKGEGCYTVGFPVRSLYFSKGPLHTVDGSEILRSPPGIYKTCRK